MHLPPLTSPRQLLAARHLPLARAIAKPFKASYPHLYDDINGVADLALVESAARFDARRGVPFAGFARARITGAILDLIHETVNRERTSLDSYTLSRDDRLSVPDAFTESVGADEEIEYLIAGFPVKSRPLIRLIFVAGLTVESAGNRLGLSKNQAMKRMLKAIERWHRPGCGRKVSLACA